jgi:aspartate/methionine/tyrosine aminotransferase
MLNFLLHVYALFLQVNVGFFLPEYTAYEEILSVRHKLPFLACLQSLTHQISRNQMFKRFVPIPHSLDAKNHYSVSVEDLRKEIQSRGLSVILKSNPSNPVGTVVQGEELRQWVKLSQETHCSMIFDEFYSSYIYNEAEPGKAVSAAEFVDDVNQDPVVIVDGLTKNWRLPGWRVTWVVGPEEIIAAVASCGSFLDGGANGPLQRAAIPLLQPEFALQDSIALQQHFKSKRDYMVARLTEMGFLIRHPPQGTFYVWASVKNMPASINNAWIFFEEALKAKVICVPGIFFDVNPGRRRQLFSSPYHYYVRFSFGPPLDELKRGLDQLQGLVQKHHELTEKSGQGSM